MLTVSKNNVGVSSTAGTDVRKGAKGRLELFATRNKNGTYSVNFADYGNYGKERWQASFGTLTKEDVTSVVNALNDLLAGKVSTTQVESSTVETTEEFVNSEDETSAENVRA